MKTYKIITTIGKNTTILPENTPIEVTLTEQEVEEIIKQYGNITPTHKRKYFVPKVGEEYWTIGSYNVEIITHDELHLDYNKIDQGNCFATEQDAQDELNRRQALVRIWNNYDDKYSWDIDWSNLSQNKYNIVYNNVDKIFSTYYGICLQTRHQSELPYFKSAEDRNQFVEENESDLLKIFNIKK